MENRTVELFSYWNRLRKARRAPRRAEVEPADIKALLSDTFILERNGEDIRFRLAGTRLCAFHGRELKGVPYPSLWRQSDRRLVTKMVENVFANSQVVTIGLRAGNAKGRSCLFEMLLLPLDGSENQQRCMGIVTAVEQAKWLGAEAIGEYAAESVRVIDPDREPLFLANRPAISVPPLAPSAGDVAPAMPAPAPGRRIGHLTVLEGGRSG